MLKVVYPGGEKTFTMSGEVFQEFDPLDVFMGFVVRGIKWEVNWNLCRNSTVHREIFVADEIARSCMGGEYVRTLH